MYLYIQQYYGLSRYLRGERLQIISESLRDPKVLHHPAGVRHHRVYISFMQSHVLVRIAQKKATRDDA